METKICTKCGEEKTIEFFYFVKNGNKFRNYCKECNKKRIKIEHDVIEDETKLKKCKRCGNEYYQSLQYFHKNNGNIGGLSHICRNCSSNNRNNRVKYETNTDKNILKTCLKCKCILPATTEYFNVSAVEKFGVKSVCSACSNGICGGYKITHKEKEDLVKKQNGMCAICGSSFENTKINVDHDHITGKVRGILCNKCNSAIGFFNDNVENLKSAIKYLENHSQNSL